MYYIVEHKTGTKHLVIWFSTHSLESARKQAMQLKKANTKRFIKILKVMDVM